MAYELNKTNGVLLLTLADGSTDTFTTSITFVGKNVFNYGEIQNENFLKLLENFSNLTSPVNPIQGQLWFDSKNDTLKPKIYDGSKWKLIPTLGYDDGSTGLTKGDFYFNATEGKLYINTGTNYTLIGPVSSSETATKLSEGRQINGVYFDGSADITITAATPQNLSPGSYLTGENFNGSNPDTWNVNVGNVEAADASTIVARNSNGDIWFRIGNGTATKARYADLAEKYLPDRHYDFGTVVKIGGNAEVTSCSLGDVAIGVVSKNPGYMMNSDLEDGIYIALKGRVPVKISGKVKKGDKLVAGNNGTAIAGLNDYFAISLEDSDDKTVIEALIL